MDEIKTSQPKPFWELFFPKKDNSTSVDVNIIIKEAEEEVKLIRENKKNSNSTLSKVFVGKPK